jgi:hypothetical protein
MLRANLVRSTSGSSRNRDEAVLTLRANNGLPRRSKKIALPRVTTGAAGCARY